MKPLFAQEPSNGLQVLPPEPHPIVHCPVDILKLIFEAAIQRPYPRDFDSNSLFSFITSTRISHVCHEWRSIALDTPRLWATIRLDISENSSSEISEYWDRLRGRLNSFPCMITVDGLRSDNFSQLDVLNEIPVIRRLDLNLESGETFNVLLDPLCSLPRTSLDELRLEVPENSWRTSHPPGTGKLASC
jgi:hypothetical protein